MEAGPSKTAMSTAVARGRHRLYDPSPWVFDDPFALLLVGPVWRVIERRTVARYPDSVGRAMLGGIVGRSRYTEDRLLTGDYAQYVILGAGLDSFVWRRPDLSAELGVFEVDHPASQAWKRDRAAVLGLPGTSSLAYVPVDFEAETLSERLTAEGFDWSRVSFFSWLGVTMYLSAAAIEATLRTVARCCPGSEVVLSYAPAEGLDDIGRQFNRIADVLVAGAGEPIVTRLSRTDTEELVRRSGLEVAEHPDHSELVGRYFSTRSDGLRPYTAEALLSARVVAHSA